MSSTRTCSRQLRIPEFPITSMRVLTLRSSDLSPTRHVTLSHASRPSTTSTTGAFSASNETRNNVFRGKQRVVVMGSAQVGKTQIVSQFLYEKFSSRYRATVEELHRGEYNLPDDSSLTLDILDTSGAFAFPAMRELSISTSNAFILVFSVDNEDSWNEVASLREQIISKRGPKVPIVIVCNKVDLPIESWCVTKEVVESIVKIDWQCGFIDCSAKENNKIIDIFKELLVQANIRYNLSPAVRRRRQSLPSFSSSHSATNKFSLKRNSCSVS